MIAGNDVILYCSHIERIPDVQRFMRQRVQEVPAIREQADVPMERVTGLASTVERTASMLGAGAAGLLIAAVGPTNALIVDAVSFALAASVLAWSTRSMPSAKASASRPGRSAASLMQHARSTCR